MLIDLNTYIRVDSVRRKLEQSCQVITTEEDANQFALNIALGNKQNAIFSKTTLKHMCFNRICELCGVKVKVINCLSARDRFDQMLTEDNSSIIVFDNVGKCKNLYILDTVLEKNEIIVC